MYTLQTLQAYIAGLLLLYTLHYAWGSKGSKLPSLITHGLGRSQPLLER